jgi:MinD superfamily P-loop ATPase
MTGEMRIPAGVVINRADIGDDAVERYCLAEGIDVLLKIPFEREIAEAYSSGDLASVLSSRYAVNFCSLYDSIRNRVNHD